MGCDTCGRIKGHIRHENIVNFIRQKWDGNVRNEVRKHIYSLFRCIIGILKSMTIVMIVIIGM